MVAKCMLHMGGASRVRCGPGKECGMKLNVPFHRQEQDHTCVPACLRMVEDELARRCGTTLLGTGRADMAQAATQLGLTARVVNQLSREDVELCLAQGRLVVAWVDPSQLYPAIFPCSH